MSEFTSTVTILLPTPMTVKLDGETSKRHFQLAYEMVNDATHESETYTDSRLLHVIVASSSCSEVISIKAPIMPIESRLL
jgi:hypothetical protein